MGGGCDEIEIKEWKDIVGELGENPSLFLGNGASIAVDPSFEYSSICKKILDCICQKENKENFQKKIDTYGKDIEKILEESVNDEYFYKNIKRIFTEVLVKNHPSHAGANHNVENETFYHYENISEFIKNFDRIFTTNYDSIIYWSILNKDNKKFKDFFWQRINNNKFPRFHAIHGNTKRCDITSNESASISYLHGAVFL